MSPKETDIQASFEYLECNNGLSTRAVAKMYGLCELQSGVANRAAPPRRILMRLNSDFENCRRNTWSNRY